MVNIKYADLLNAVEKGLAYLTDFYLVVLFAPIVKT